MKRSLVTVLIVILVSGCSGSRDSTPAPVTEVPHESNGVLTAAAFNQIKDYILVHGDRQTYCNMFNNNPHVALGDMDIYLNPDTGQQNINCDLKLSDFNHMVIRTRSPMRYFRFALNLKSTGPDLIVQKETNSEELAGVLQNAISKLKEKANNLTR